MTDNTQELDEILELLHNSWLEDDYDPRDINAIEAKQAITSVINQQVIQARDNIVQIIRSTDYTPKSLDESYDRALIELYKNQLIDLIKEYKGE